MRAELPIVTRRDLLGAECLLCEGTYKEAWLLTALGEVLSCDTCGCVIERFLTKREMLEVQVAHLELGDNHE